MSEKRQSGYYRIEKDGKHEIGYFRNGKWTVNAVTYVGTDFKVLDEIPINPEPEAPQVKNLEWRAMKTAPKDGTPILVVEEIINYDKSIQYRIMLVEWKQENSFYKGKNSNAWCMGSEQDEQGGHDTADNPIAWQPLPTPLKV